MAKAHLPSKSSIRFANRMGSLFALLLIIVQYSHADVLRSSYLKQLDYFSLPQLIKKENCTEAIRFLFNGGGDFPDGDINVTIFRLRDSLCVRKTVKSETNLWICLKRSEKKQCQDTCCKVGHLLDTVPEFIDEFIGIREAIRTTKQKKISNGLYDGKFCTAEYATVKDVKRIDIGILKDSTNKIFKLGLLAYCYARLPQELNWLDKKYLELFGSSKIDNKSIIKQLHSLIKEKHSR